MYTLLSLPESIVILNYLLSYLLTYLLVVV